MKLFAPIHWVRVLSLVAAVAASGVLMAQQQENSQAGDTAADKVEKAATDGLYDVPEGDVAALLAFIERIEKFKPANVLELYAHRKQAGEAIRKAAEKILTLEKDKKSEAYKTAKLLLLQIEVGSLPSASPEQQQETYAKVSKLIAKEGPSPGMFGLAYRTASGLEYGNNKELAGEAFKKFGAIFATSDNPELASVAEKLIGAARRMKLEGKPIKISGENLKGEPVDWASYRGKVVLIDFWATWCGPCLQILPQVREVHEKYHGKGFDVLGISIDQDRQALEDFVKENDLPWETLHDPKGEGSHPVADYYGVLGIPTLILVGSDGNVITTQARGEDLEALVAEQLGIKLPEEEAGE